MSVITHEQEDCNSILSLDQKFFVSRTSTQPVKSSESDGDILEDLFYSVCIGNSVLTRKTTKQEIKYESKSSCFNCISF